MIGSNKDRVEGLLKDYPQGLTIEELSSHAKLSRNTIKLILAELKGEKKIIERRVGMAKLIYWDFKRKTHTLIQRPSVKAIPKSDYGGPLSMTKKKSILKKFKDD